ncbi:hypothetical protein Tco_0744495 [Tanacetum coccineum]
MNQVTPFDMEFENGINMGQHSEIDQRMVADVCQEVIKMFKSKNGAQEASILYHAGIKFYGYSYALSCNYSNQLKSIPDGTQKEATMVGNVKFIESLTLYNVFYVPDFRFNLLFVGRLLNTQNMAALFFPNWFLFQDLSTDKVVAYGKGTNHLYTCNASSSLHDSFKLPYNLSELQKFSFANKCSSTGFNVTQSELSVFHDRIGHTSLSKMTHINDYKSLDTTNYFCDTCLTAKNHRLPFNRSTTSSSVPFELLHVDLWGSYKTPALNGV